MEQTTVDSDGHCQAAVRNLDRSSPAIEEQYGVAGRKKFLLLLASETKAVLRKAGECEVTVIDLRL